MQTRTQKRSAINVGRSAIIAGAIIAITGLWYMASVPWGLALSELLPFVAPGALLGIGTAWMAYALKPERWTWKTARTAAITGALVLPPIITVALALIGARPERVLSSTVRSAWVALAGGAIWGVGTWLLARLDRRAA